MPGKQLTYGRLLGVLLCALAGPHSFSAETGSSGNAPRFLGSQSCATSGCHGGAGELSKQVTVWRQYDVHFQRPVATLTTARSERLAQVLKIADPTKDARCTACHAPLQTVPTERLSPDVKITEGVSCENCHGPAENWLLSHTRKDYTHEDRVHAGMRDLKNPYVRANTCVACHQNVDSELLRAGHPELIFELDGQAVTQPKHWRKEIDKPGPQLWLVGQLVALREMTSPRAITSSETNRFQQDSQLQNYSELELGLHWLLSKVRDLLKIRGAEVPNFGYQGPAHIWWDSAAKEAASLDWSAEMTRSCLQLLANTGDEFLDEKVSRSAHARRAERLVLALDRLTQALPSAKTAAVNEALNRLFTDAQSLPDFNSAQFAKDLKEFHVRVASALETK